MNIPYAVTYNRLQSEDNLVSQTPIRLCWSSTMLIDTHNMLYSVGDLVRQTPIFAGRQVTEIHIYRPISYYNYHENEILTLMQKYKYKAEQFDYTSRYHVIHVTPQSTVVLVLNRR